MRREAWRDLRMGDVAGELTVGEVFLRGFVEVRWYPYGWSYVRNLVVRAADVRLLARLFSEAHGGKAVVVWFTRRRRGQTEPRMYLVGKVRRLDGSTEETRGGMRRELGADWEGKGKRLGARFQVSGFRMTRR